MAGAATVSCRKATPEKPAVPQAAVEGKGATSPAKDVMKSTLAGSWYVADGNALRAEIAGYFKEAKIDPRDDIIGLILPHAGYAYSGRTAACAVKSLGRSYTRVVIIGPTHYLPMEDMFSVLRATHYQSPLGEVPLDVEFVGRLLKYSIFQDVPAAHEQEHSVQIEVPLLQYKLGDFKLVPIVAGQCSYETVAQAGKILASLIDKDTLVVASSDFTHYGPRYEYVPFTKDIPQNLKTLDMDAFAIIANKDPRNLLEYRRKTGVTICGYVPISVLLAMLPGGARPNWSNIPPPASRRTITRTPSATSRQPSTAPGNRRSRPAYRRVTTPSRRRIRRFCCRWRERRFSMRWRSRRCRSRRTSASRAAKRSKFLVRRS
jgi:hypothetical protein